MISNSCVYASSSGLCAFAASSCGSQETNGKVADPCGLLCRAESAILAAAASSDVATLQAMSQGVFAQRVTPEMVAARRAASSLRAPSDLYPVCWKVAAVLLLRGREDPGWACTPWHPCLLKLRFPGPGGGFALHQLSGPDLALRLVLLVLRLDLRRSAESSQAPPATS